jgi:hypothetical protein
MMTLWCMARSPLMLGCDLPSSPPETLELLTNADLLDVLRASRNNRELLRDGNLVVWAAESTTTADRFAAVFNTGGGTLEAAFCGVRCPRTGSGSTASRESRDGGCWAFGSCPRCPKRGCSTLGSALENSGFLDRSRCCQAMARDEYSGVALMFNGRRAAVLDQLGHYRCAPDRHIMHRNS